MVMTALEEAVGVIVMTLWVVECKKNYQLEEVPCTSVELFLWASRLCQLEAT
jgi:hypothetical protein